MQFDIVFAFGNITNRWFWTSVISLISTSDIHGALVVHLPVFLVGIIIIEWAGICIADSSQVSHICDNFCKIN